MSDNVRISKSLSYWLRHRPDAAGLILDAQGWTSVDGVLRALAGAGLTDQWETLLEVVETSDKQRFEFSPDASLIRARQGHSVSVDLDWPATPPPAVLFHGTVDRFLDAILAEGLKPMRRHHVHLSGDVGTATKVGQRRGRPVILEVDAGSMAAAGIEFLLTANGVWLTERVGPAYLKVRG